MGFYYDDEEKKIIKEGLLDVVSQKKAQEFYFDRLHRNQLRRFYNEFKNLETKYKSKSRELLKPEIELTEANYVAFLQIKPLVKMVKSKAEYAKKKIPKSFLDWLNESINMVEDERDFTAFLLSFEAVVGFYYGYSK